MPRPRVVFAICITSALWATSARAQYGYGMGGWGGWGASTVQGDIARGMGVFAAGAGMYNLDTAQATSINTDTWMRWNQYIFQSQQEATKRYYESKYKDIQRNKEAYNRIISRIQDTPTSKDVESGDALNAAMDQLSDPRIHSSALRSATSPIEAEMIRNIPFRNNTEAVTIALSRIKDATKWPAVLDTERFANDKKMFEEVVEQARKEDEVGEISQETLSRANDLIADLRMKLDGHPLADTADNLRAIKFVKSLAGLVRLLGKNDTRQVLDELRKVKTTSVGNLLGFMHAFNLRFGPATTPAERITYRQLFEILDQTRDKIISAVKLDSPPPSAKPEQVGDFFSSMNMDQLQGKNPPAPAPPKPQN